ncbi:hypothetical protein PPACK8108_LOCUS21400 [Phakopsora pachyrhizi]|uniref:Uncharacterized protein n=1 Tax=Phakopsora pachyrhizi TaxID=170000 RepID=A0AAV0BHD0_PHAPC|nr:hypothetical protein PPACK8108_LOCUS21400 [Phakopsora pachyrhizi]
MNLGICSNQMKKELKRFMSQFRRPTNKNKKVVLDEDQFQRVVFTRRDDLWSEDYHGEARTDRLDYDLRGWEPEE